MVSVTNKNLHHAIDICGKIIKPQESRDFEKVDTDIINYYISTGDIEVNYTASVDKKPKAVSRRQLSNDTIIIDGDGAGDNSSEENN